MNRQKKTTIQMVADIAGVSRGTVDRVLNDRAHVRKDIREKVLQALQETGYVSPRGAYQNKLFSDNFRPITLGVLLPNWNGHFRWEIDRGIEQARDELKEFHVTVMYEECQTDIPEEAIEKLDLLIKKGAEGIALCVVNDLSVCAKINELADDGIPIITFNSDLPDSKRISFIGQDYTLSGRIAGEIIRKYISFDDKVLACVGNLEFSGHKERLDGFMTRMAETNIPAEHIHIIETYNDYALTFKKVTDSLKEIPNVHTIYMANRSVSGCVKAVESMGLSEKIHIICHDISENTKSLLTRGDVDFSISQDINRQGYLPLIYLRNILQKKELPPEKDMGSNISIICSQNFN